MNNVKKGLVGLSLSRCALDIAEGKVFLGDVVAIVSRTNIECGSSLDDVLKRWRDGMCVTLPENQRDKFEAAVREIYNTGRLIQPKLEGEEMPSWHRELVSNGCCWVGTVESFNEYRSARTLGYELASRVQAVKNCIKSKNTEWDAKHREAIEQLLDALPHGSGIDGEWRIEPENCSDSVITLFCSYHHMNDGGYYDGWTDFTVKIRPSFYGIDVKVTGAFPPKYRDTREYLQEILHMALSRKVYWSLDRKGDLHLHHLED